MTDHKEILRTYNSCRRDETGGKTLEDFGITPKMVGEAIDAVLKDAERYEWLCASAWYVGPEPRGDTESVSWHDKNETRGGVSVAIDAARSEGVARNG